MEIFVLLIGKASAVFLEIIREQDSQAYERLSGLWEENVTANESELKERFTVISEVLSGYIRDMGSYIAPTAPALERREFHGQSVAEYLSITYLKTKLSTKTESKYGGRRYIQIYFVL